MKSPILATAISTIIVYGCIHAITKVASHNIKTKPLVESTVKLSVQALKNHLCGIKIMQARAMIKKNKSLHLPNRGKVAHNNISLTKEDKLLLAKIISGESGAEPFEGKVAVGVVILNRLNYGGYGNTLKEVCYAGNGSQFNCVREKWFGRYTEDDMKAVEFAIDTYNNGKYPKNLLYFVNVKISGDTKFVRNTILKNKYMKIGSHTFATKNTKS